MAGESCRRVGVAGATFFAFVAVLAVLFSAGAAPASAEPTMVEAKVLGQVEPLGSNSYREVAVAIRLSEPVDFGSTALPASAFTATLLPSTNRLIGSVYTNDEQITRPERTNVPGQWLIIEFSTTHTPSPFSPAGLSSRQYSIYQGQTISGNGTTISAGGAIVTTGVYSPVLDEFQPASVPVTGESAMLYQYFTPREVRDNRGWEGAKYPLVLALHGSGERGDANSHDNLRQMLANQLGVAWAMPDRQAENPAYVIVPQARTMGGSPTSNPLSWGVPARKEALVGLINDFVTNHRVDPRRIYITGVSMGGMGTWDMYSSYPSLFAAAVPIASGIQTDRGMTVAMVPPLANKPLWNLHAANDGVVSNNGSILARTTLSGLGVTVNHAEFAGNLSRAAANSAAAAQLAAANLAGSKHLFTTYTSGTVTPQPHESWQPAFINDTVYDWLFSQTVDGGPVLALPAAPAAPTAVAGDSEVSLTWQVPASQGGAQVDNYVVRAYENGSLIDTIHVGATLEATVEELVNGTVYTFTVQAESAVGAGPESATVAATPVGVPSAPQELSALVDDRNVDLTWQAPASNGGLTVHGYVIDIIRDSVVMPSIETENVTSHRLTGLNYGSTYEITVRALNGAGQGAASNAVQAVISDLLAPNTKITSSPNNKALKLSKKNKAKVKFKFTSTEAGSTFQCRINSGSLNKWKTCKSGVSYSLKPGSYTFQVRATDAGGNSDPSPAKKKIKVTKKK